MVKAAFAKSYAVYQGALAAEQAIKVRCAQGLITETYPPDDVVMIEPRQV